MFLWSRNPIVPFIFQMSMTLTLQSYNLCKVIFVPYFGYYWTKHGQILTEGSWGKIFIASRNILNLCFDD